MSSPVPVGQERCRRAVDGLLLPPAWRIVLKAGGEARATEAGELIASIPRDGARSIVNVEQG